MDLKKIEDMVLKCKKDNSYSKEELLKSFTPFIINLSRKTFIDGYTFEDIQNECYKSLLHSLNKYKIGSNSFVKYALMSIRNNLNYLIKKRITHYSSDGKASLTLSDNLEHTLESTEIPMDESLNYKFCCEILHNMINTLEDTEKELIYILYVKEKTLTYYAHFKKMNYCKARYKHQKLLKKLNQKFSLNHIYSIEKN